MKTLAGYRFLPVLYWVVGLSLLFVVYTSGVSRNPPGFYLDESVTAYNAYLLAHTGAGESGPRFPVFIEVYHGTYAAHMAPLDVYLLAVVFRFLPPSILLVRVYSAFLMFGACLLLGLLAKQLSQRYFVGAVIAAFALGTPWLFEVGRLAWEAHLIPVLTVLFLLALYRVHRKQKWNWRDVGLLALTLALLTYSYAGGRILAPLLAAGLIFFVTSKARFIGVAASWGLYGITLIPITLFGRAHPDALAKRFAQVSYLRETIPLGENIEHFVRRFLEDQSLERLLVTGDEQARHHLPGSGGPFLWAAFILAVGGVLLVVAFAGRSPWWRFVLYGVVVAIIPSAIGDWSFHFLRLLALPVFLLVLAVPALEWLVAAGGKSAGFSSLALEPWRGAANKDHLPSALQISLTDAPRSARILVFCLVFAFGTAEASRFQTIYRRDGPKRLGEFDAHYKEAYAAAVAQPSRPIYLEDGGWGPAYIHAFWYATLEHRPTSEFAYLPPGTKPPHNAVVMSTGEPCEKCQVLKRSYVYVVYKAP